MRTIWHRRLALLAVIVVAPLLIHSWLSKRDSWFDQLINSYECVQDICPADFNGDGVNGRVERIPDASSHYDWLVVVDGESEILRLPYHFVDGTLRTHVAIHAEMQRPRLLIFDGTRGRNGIFSAVYAWDGTKLAKTSSSDRDQEIFLALKARDDAGTWAYWGLFRAFSIPVLLAYYFLVGCFVIAFALRQRFGQAQSTRLK